MRGPEPRGAVAPLHGRGLTGGAEAGSRARSRATVAGVSSDTGPSTGEQYEIAAGGTRAVVTGVGAGLRVCEVDGAAIVESFAADGHPPMGAGGVLVPWPNRLAGARFSWHGREYRPEVTEPARGHAIHGLLRRVAWEPRAHEGASVTLAASVPASEGWPQPLSVATSYTVAPGRLHVEHTVTAEGDGDVPVGVGTHPYLRVGDAPVGDCVLTAATGSVVEVDEGLVPVSVRCVEPVEDLRDGQRVGGLQLDTCFGTERLDEDDTLAALAAPDGASVRLVADPGVRWLQVFTPESPFRPGSGPAVAVEPMTCPPDALHSGTDLRVLAPGETWRVTWGLVASWGAA